MSGIIVNWESSESQMPRRRLIGGYRAAVPAYLLASMEQSLR